MSISHERIQDDNKYITRGFYAIVNNSQYTVWYIHRVTSFFFFMSKIHGEPLHVGGRCVCAKFWSFLSTKVFISEPSAMTWWQLLRFPSGKNGKRFVASAVIHLSMWVSLEQFGIHKIRGCTTATLSVLPVIGTIGLYEQNHIIIILLSKLNNAMFDSVIVK